jgi:hypothetical protein
MAKHRCSSRIPYCNEAALVCAHQAVAERHGDTLKASLCDQSEQISKVDFIEGNSCKIRSDDHMKQ